MIHIGLDIGGSKISLLVQDETGKPLTYHKEPIQKNYDAFLAQIFGLTDAFKNQKQITLGIAIPGRILKTKDNCTVNPANLPFLKDKNFGQDLKKHFGFLPAIENDANCFALSEAIEGAGKGFDYVFGLILGTGVGGALTFKREIIAATYRSPNAGLNVMAILCLAAAVKQAVSALNCLAAAFKNAIKCSVVTHQKQLKKFLLTSMMVTRSP